MCRRGPGFSRVERVDRVELFMRASRHHYSIIYSRFSIRGPNTFAHKTDKFSCTFGTGSVAYLA